MFKEYELKPMFENVKSYYGKAIVKIENDNIQLLSYGIPIAEIVDNNSRHGRVAIVYDTYSNTTLRHIKEFLKQYGFKADNKKQIISDYKN